MDNLAGRQLLSGAEIVFSDGNRVGEGEPNDKLVQEQQRKDRPTKRLKTVRDQATWVKTDLSGGEPLFPEPDFSSFRGLSAVEIFELIFDDEVLDLLVCEPTRYALFMNCPDPKVTAKEMRVFLAILILSGYCVVPGKRFYWESASDMRNEMVYNAMRRERFAQIMRFVHLVDNTKPDLNDKMWKLRPFMTLLKKKFLTLFRPVRQFDYDESMVAYYGRHGCKQFIRGKPIRFGYKVWSLNMPNGFLVNFDVYQGCNPNQNAVYEELFGKCAAPLVQMIDEFPEQYRQLPYHFYFDNLFTSMNLLKQLKERGYSATGTIRDNRIPKDCPLPGKKDMSKKNRGSFESVTCEPHKIIIVRWMDNAVVTVASTVHGVKPLASVQRYSQAEKKVVQVTRPHLIGEYNKYMGGTDLMDENVSLYRVGIRGKKWWWPLFTWLLDISIHNAWILMKQAGQQLSQLEFRRSVVQTYLTRFMIPPKGPGRPVTSHGSMSDSRISDDLRYDGLDHLVHPTEEGKRRRCAGQGCTTVGRTECRKCGVGLCVPCFGGFHKR